MKKTINVYDFERAFAEMDRKDNFSYEGKKALFDYIESIEEDTGEEIELDVIALCCEFSEYENLEEVKDDYRNIETLEDLEDRTQVIYIEGTDRLIIQNF